MALVVPAVHAQDSAAAGPRCIAGQPSRNYGVELLTNYGMYGIGSIHNGGGHFRVAADWGPILHVGHRSATFALSAGVELSGVTGMIATGATVVGVLALVYAYVRGDDL